MPRFSIVIPTRNRAYLLRYALQSALSQTFEDYEILVSNNNCSDNTDEIVEELRDERVRYVHTDRTLPMPDHWEFALEKARGQYLTYLCDDDVITPVLLERINDIVESEKSELVSWSYIRYFHPTWDVPEEKNLARVEFPFSGDAHRVDSKADLEDVFSFIYHVRHPKMLNSVCSRDLLARVREACSRVFLPPCPDYSFCAAVLGMTDSYSFVDLPLYIAGSARESIGSAQLYHRGEAAYQFRSEFSEDDILARMPLKSMLTTSYVADSILKVKERMSEELTEVSIDWGEYFNQSYYNLTQLRGRGVDTRADEKELIDVLERQPEEIRQQAWKSIHRWRDGVIPPQRQGKMGRLRQAARTMIAGSPVLSTVESLVRHGSIGPSTTGLAEPRLPADIRGDQYGFQNILECLSKIDDLCKDFMPPGGSASRPLLRSDRRDDH